MTYILPRTVSRGFSLIEVLIAFVVLTIGMLSLLTVYPYAFEYIGERDDELQAVAFGQQYMESVRSQFWTGTATAAATPAPTTAPVDYGYPSAFGAMGYFPNQTPTPAPLGSSSNFTASVSSVTQVGSNPSAYDVTIKVTWPTANQPVFLESIMTGQAL
jgi:prepilin-type N-terminal cleavage/methylation domain-containing protein